MKRSVLNQLGELDRKSLGYIAELSYVYGNICVKADPVSLLDLEVEEEGYTYKIENLAHVIVHDKEGDDDKMDIIPMNGDEDLKTLSEAVAVIHPEFIQSFEVIDTGNHGESGETGGTGDGSDDKFKDEQRHFMRLTMPPVNKNRKDLLTDGVNLAYENCNAKLEAINVYFEGSIAANIVGETEKDVESVKKMLEETKRKYAVMADQFKSDKLNEIDAAYRRHIGECAEPDGDDGGESSQWKKLKME